ncbi:MAG TPA: hypothetical protein VEA15_05025 [Caulobacteraceae bacterium]|nr:hypothetical protein [Caulobacteraceae bacterium]
MLEILQFVFSSIWHFLGTVVLLGVIFDGLTSVVQALRGEPARTVGGKLRGTITDRGGTTA